MTDFNPVRLRGHLRAASNSGATTHVRGRAYEDALTYIFDNVPGCTTRRNSLNKFDSEEIDIIVGNLQVDAGLKMLPRIFLVECKNWSVPVDSATVSVFLQKIEHRACKLGILVAANGVTGDPDNLKAAYHQASLALAKGILLFLVTSQDLIDLTCSEDFVELLHARFLDLHVSGTFTVGRS
ncbi:restriction endonuclease [Streptomyces decoyicus]|uniref:restriction endonuclease n=1 Tax=Streptomyces decoyicus TaxID=249567 RepID=UPI003863B55A|nr:restriction endonuclease [Streptomyces decoyicus]